MFYKDIIENTGTFLAKIMLMIYISMHSFKISFILIPLFCSTFMNLMIKSISFNKCQILSEIVNNNLGLYYFKNSKVACSD